MSKKIITKEVVFPRKLIQEKIADYAEKLNKIYRNKKLMVISVLNGAVFFATELIKHLKMDVSMDFVAVSSYAENKKKKEAHFYKELKINVENENVLVVEDIIDSGHTIKLVYDFLKRLKAKNIRVVSLISAQRTAAEQKQFPFPIDNLLTLKNNLWVVGFGIDFEEKFRNLNDIYSIECVKSKKLIKIK